jgi:hypothetical protein
MSLRMGFLLSAGVLVAAVIFNDQPMQVRYRFGN